MKKLILYVIRAIVVFFIIINIIPQRDVTSKNPFIIEEDDRAMIIAHRGGKDLFPENTIMAFDGSMEIGVDVLEMDARLTKDNILVTHHDETIDRTSDGKGKIIDYTYNELKEFNFGEKFIALDGSKPYENEKVQIISIDELLNKYGNQVLFVIEIKDSGENGIKSANELVRLIKKYNMEDRVLVASFHNEIFKYIIENYDNIMVSTPRKETKEFVIKSYTLTSLFFSKKPSAIEIPIKDSGIVLDTNLLIHTAHRRNIAVHYWTINDKETMKDLIEKGADGLITDRPDLMKEVLDKIYN